MEAVKCEAFLAAAELGSLTATAELLGYTQSGVTRMIGTLEEELGFPLFLRSKKPPKWGAFLCPALPARLAAG